MPHTRRDTNKRPKFTSLFFMFLQFWVLCASFDRARWEDECRDSDSKGPVKAVANMAAPARGFHKLLPLGSANVTGEPPANITEMLNGPYILSLVGFVIPWIFFVIFLMFWFCCQSCCTCCCACIPAKPGTRPSICLIVTHCIFWVVYVIGAIFLCVSADNLRTGFTGIPERADIFHDYITDLSSTIAEAMINGSKSARLMSVTLSNRLLQIKATVSVSLDKATSQAPNAKTKMTQFQNEVDACGTSSLTPETRNKIKAYMNPKVQNVVSLADALTTYSDKLTKAADKATSLNDGVVRVVVTEMNGMVERMPETLRDVLSMNESSDEVSAPLVWLGDIAGKYIALFPPIIAAIILVVAVLYLVLFFFTNCCSRCWFRCFGCCSYWTLLAVMMTVPIGILFMVADDYCSKVGFEQTIVNAKVDLLGETPVEDQVNMLICEEDKPLFEMGLLGLFDYNAKVTTPFMETAEGLGDSLAMKNFDIEEFKGVGVGLLDLKNWDIPTVVGYDSIQYASGDKKDQFVTCVKSKSSTLRDAAMSGIQMAPLGDNFYMMVKAASYDGMNLASLVNASVNETISEGIESLTCAPHKCAYSVFDEMICKKWRDGFAWWVMGVVLLIVGSMLLTFTANARYRTMSTPQVEADSSVASDSSSGYSSGSSSSSYSSSSSSNSVTDQEDPNMVKFQARPL